MVTINITLGQYECDNLSLCTIKQRLLRRTISNDVQLQTFGKVERGDGNNNGKEIGYLPKHALKEEPNTMKFFSLGKNLFLK